MKLELFKKIIEKEQEIDTFYGKASDIGIDFCETVASKGSEFINNALWQELIEEDSYHLLRWFAWDNNFGKNKLEYTQSDDGVSFKCNDIETLHKRIFKSGKERLIQEGITRLEETECSVVQSLEPMGGLNMRRLSESGIPLESYREYKRAMAKQK